MDQIPCVALIDDDHAWREALADYLRRYGFRVRLARNAEQGMRILKQGGISTIICDYNLPKEDGLKLVRRIRSLRLAVVILMVSSEDEPSLPRRALAAGVQAFLAKTASPNTLLQKIRQLTSDPLDPSGLHKRLQLWQRLLPSPFRREPSASA